MALPSAGYDSATITNPGVALSDFTLIIDLSRMSASWWADNNTSEGPRGRASKTDGTELACDWIDFDDIAQTGLLRVKWTGTLAASGSQIIRIYTPNTRNTSYSASDTYGSDNAYDVNWKGYWPLGDDYNDRTANSNDGTASDTISQVTGKLGNARAFDGAVWVSITDTTDLDFSDEFYLSWWYHPDASQADPDSATVCKTNSPSSYDGYIAWYNGGTIDAYINGARRVDSSTSISTSGFSHGALSWDGSNTYQTWINGATDTTDSYNTAPSSAGVDFIIGGYPVGEGASLGDRCITADMQDIQAHNIERSSDWIEHEYEQFTDQATFWGTWSWTAAESPPTPVTGSPWNYYMQLN